MKCPNCGGEVDSQSTACPYCNSVYEPGRLFQLELAEKIAKNKLMPKFILERRTPEMASMFLSRIIISLFVAAIVFLAISFGIYLIGGSGLEREATEGSYAWKYFQESERRIDNEMVREYMYEIVIAMDTGEEVEEYQLDYVLTNSIDMLQDEPDSHGSNLIKAFMTGYLQMTKEEIADLIVDRDYSERDDYVEALAEKLLLRMGGGE